MPASLGRHRPNGEGTMVEEPLEIWERRIDKLLDRKLEPIKHKLQQQESMLKQTQKFLAVDAIFSKANRCRDKVFSINPFATTFFERLTARLALAQKEVKTSRDPLSVATSFGQWCHKEEKEFGITTIDDQNR